MSRGNFDKEKKKLADSIRFDIPNVPFGVGHCVYKLWYGNKFLINKGKDLAGSLFLLQKGYAYHVAYEQKEADDKANKLFIKFYRYIQKHPGLKFSLDVLFESNNPYQVLKHEQIALNEALNDKKCLNNNIEPYIPQYRPNLKSYGWINKSSYLNFRKFQKKNT